MTCEQVFEGRDSQRADKITRHTVYPSQGDIPEQMLNGKRVVKLHDHKLGGFQGIILVPNQETRIKTSQAITTESVQDPG